MMQTTLMMTKTMAHGYSSESTQGELSKEYQYNRVYMIFENVCVLELWTNVAPAFEGFEGCGLLTISS